MQSEASILKKYLKKGHINDCLRRLQGAVDDHEKRFILKRFYPKNSVNACLKELSSQSLSLQSERKAKILIKDIVPHHKPKIKKKPLCV